MASRDATLQSITQSDQAGVFAIAMLQLCQASYLSPDNVAAAIATVKPLTPGGVWHCTWGPALDWDASNLAVVATYAPLPGAPPMLSCVNIRGTDLDLWDGWGVVEQLWEDLDCTMNAALPWAPNDPARVASGTLDALNVIRRLTSNGQTIVDYLTSFFGNSANSSTLLTIGGHSLGGCLTTVVAPWLKSELGAYQGPILPVTFAAPTAGNKDFAAYYEKAFPVAPRYVNTRDIVPLAWSDLSATEAIYKPCSIALPDVVYAGVLGFEAAMSFAGVSYAQPLRDAHLLPGTCADTTSWYDQALDQHHTTTYMTLLGGTNLGGVTMPAPAGRRSTAPTLSASVGPLPAAVQQIRAAAKGS